MRPCRSRHVRPSHPSSLITHRSYERNLKEWLAAHSPKTAPTLKGTSVATLHDVKFNSSTNAASASDVDRQASAIAAVLKAEALAEEIRAEEEV